MRLIKEIVRAILKLLFNIDTESPGAELLENRKEQQTLALLFYSYLNDKPDKFLESNDFSREEIKLGIERVASALGLGSVAEMFLKDLS